MAKLASKMVAICECHPRCPFYPSTVHMVRLCLSDSRCQWGSAQWVERLLDWLVGWGMGEKEQNGSGRVLPARVCGRLALLSAHWAARLLKRQAMTAREKASGHQQFLHSCPQAANTWTHCWIQNTHGGGAGFSKIRLEDGLRGPVSSWPWAVSTGLPLRCMWALWRSDQWWQWMWSPSLEASPCHCWHQSRKISMRRIFWFLWFSSYGCVFTVLPLFRK